MLIGFSLVGTGILFAVLVDYRDVSLNNSGCSLSSFLYDTGEARTYLVASLHNLGSKMITSASITFTDDFKIEHGFYDDSLAIDPGHVWEIMNPFPASVSPKKNYVIKSTAVMDDGSVTRCSVVYEIGP